MGSFVRGVTRKTFDNGEGADRAGGHQAWRQMLLSQGKGYGILQSLYGSRQLVYSLLRRNEGGSKVALRSGFYDVVSMRKPKRRTDGNRVSR
jgi:hypothetical protein